MRAPHLHSKSLSEPAGAILGVRGGGGRAAYIALGARQYLTELIARTGVENSSASLFHRTRRKTRACIQLPEDDGRGWRRRE